MSQPSPCLTKHRHQHVVNRADGTRLQVCTDCGCVIAALPYTPSSSDTRGTDD